MPIHLHCYFVIRRQEFRMYPLRSRTARNHWNSSVGTDRLQNKRRTTICNDFSSFGIESDSVNPEPAPFLLLFCFFPGRRVPLPPIIGEQELLVPGRRKSTLQGLALEIVFE
jgi:hypothetical protein